MLISRRLPKPSFLVSTPRHSERNPPLAFFCHDFGASEATICSNRGSPRSGSQNGNFRQPSRAFRRRCKPQLVVRDKEGKVNTVRYEQINAMLLNEFLKEHKRVEEQEVMISDLKKDLVVLTAQLKERAGEIRKVSAQVEMMRPLTRVARSYP